MSDIFQEVEEDVRREHYEALWKQYGHYALALAVLLIIGVAGWQWYQNYDRTRRLEQIRFRIVHVLAALECEQLEERVVR